MSSSGPLPSAPLPSAIEVEIREFEPGDETAFRQLNEEWIMRYFGLEASDVEVLADPQKTILDRGGKIFFAVTHGRAIGCCALRRLSESEYEVAKMGVSSGWQGAGIGRKLLEAVIAAGHKMGASRLCLETNHILTPAIRLYESVGFRHVPLERIVPSDYARADVYMEMFLK